MALCVLALAVLPTTGGFVPGAVHRCRRAVMIDGVLRCDGDAPRTVGDLCGASHPRAATSLLGGDAIDVVALCFGGPEAGVGRMPADALLALDQPTDLNRATAEELEGLPGIGPRLAARIVERRPFASVDELAEVRGIGPATLDRLRPRLVVAPAVSGR